MMKFNLVVIAVSLAILLSACSTPVGKKAESTNEPAFEDHESQLYSDLQNWLPGYYSNYTQLIEAGAAEDSVIDLNISQLPTPNEPVFLFESKQRFSVLANYDLYFVKRNPASGQLELHFTRMTGSDLSKSLPETLDIGWQRAVPGCVITLAPFNRQTLTSVDRQLFGKSNTETCRFEDPIHGEIGFERSLSISSNQINMTGVELKPGEGLEVQPEATHFQKQQAFEGTVSLNSAITGDDKDTPGWQTSTTSNLYDDGRVSHLYDAEMEKMVYAIRLSRLHWRENEPPYLKLEVIHLESGLAQAYSWFDPDLKQIDWELDWVKVHLKELTPEEPNPNSK